MLYCIEHERMVNPYPSPYADLSHADWVSSADGEPFEDLEYCDFNGGWATIPPPEFDMEEFMETVGEQTIESDFLAYDYDVETDQIVTEVFP